MLLDLIELLLELRVLVAQLLVLLTQVVTFVFDLVFHALHHSLGSLGLLMVSLDAELQCLPLLIKQSLQELLIFLPLLLGCVLYGLQPRGIEFRCLRIARTQVLKLIILPPGQRQSLQHVGLYGQVLHLVAQLGFQLLDRILVLDLDQGQPTGFEASLV